MATLDVPDAVMRFTLSKYRLFCPSDMKLYVPDVPRIRPPLVASATSRQRL